MSDKDPYGDQQPPPYGDEPTSYGDQPASYGDEPASYGGQPAASGGQPPQYGGPPPPSGGGDSPWSGGRDAAASEAKGFFGALFDFSFTHFVTPKIVKVVYILATIGLSLMFVIFLITSFINDVVLGFVVLLIGPIVFLVYLALIRMTLEFYFALVRMSEDIHERLPR